MNVYVYGYRNCNFIHRAALGWCRSVTHALYIRTTLSEYIQIQYTSPFSPFQFEWQANMFVNDSFMRQMQIFYLSLVLNDIYVMISNKISSPTQHYIYTHKHAYMYKHFW